MEPGLISKKDLLQQTGISYGQLYRWKRKNLIPEDWFIRKSTFTGQETFFPRDKMLARVERILSMKEGDLSLDDIADAVSPDLGGVSLSVSRVAETGIASEVALGVFAELHPEATTLVFGELLSLYVLDQLLGTGDISREEGRGVLSTLEEQTPAFEGSDGDLLCVRKMGVLLCAVVSSSAELRFESGARTVARVNMQESVEALGARLQ
jgi:DNA-binding transcriptional MerR regulator